MGTELGDVPHVVVLVTGSSPHHLEQSFWAEVPFSVPVPVSGV